MIDSFESKKYFTTDHSSAMRIHLITEETYQTFFASQDDHIKKQMNFLGFNFKKDHFTCLYPALQDSPFGLIILGKETDPYAIRILKKLSQLPQSVTAFQLIHSFAPKLFDLQEFACLWAADHYRYDWYKTSEKNPIKLYLDTISDSLIHHLRAVFMGRNLINAPAQDIMPKSLEDILNSFSQEFGGTCHTITGNSLLEENFNLIHAVGRGICDRDREPRLIDYKFHHSDQAPCITLIGKGVCFDSGGLNIKGEAGMLLMKKDMGGAATVIALALYLLQQKPQFNLRVLIPTAENNITANSFRPGDIYKSYSGKTIEITNTDAEGRLLLADALAYADQDNPDLIIDIATLTGAARVALGPDLPVFFTDNAKFSQDLYHQSHLHHDPVWQLPLWKNYEDAMHGTISDLINSEAGSMAGSIKAALFLKNFVKNPQKWIHFDSYCYVNKSKPGKPSGGEIMPFATLIAFIQNFIDHFQRETPDASC